MGKTRLEKCSKCLDNGQPFGLGLSGIPYIGKGLQNAYYVKTNVTEIDVTCGSWNACCSVSKVVPKRVNNICH